MNLGFTEMVFIFLLALIIFGPRKLPEIGRQIGKAMAEFKRHSNDFKAQLQTEIRQIELDEAVKKLERDVPPPAPPQGSVAQKLDDDPATMTTAEPCDFPPAAEAPAKGSDV